MEDAADELREALSDEGMQRYVTPAPVPSQPESRQEPAPEPEDEIIPYRWNAKNIRIAVAGAQRRSGVTVTAFNLAAWLAARGAEVAYIEVNTNRHLQLLLNVYEAAPMICLFIQRERLTLPWKERGRLPLFLVIFLPLAALTLYYLLTNGSFTYAFIAPLAVTLLVGVAEETMFRRILFIRLLGLFQERGSKKALLISAVCFSLLHAVNILGGSPAPQVLMQLAATFVAGLFYVLMFDYTRNIYLLIIMHFLWDYILFSGATKQIPVYAVLMGILQAAEIVIMLVLLARKWRQDASAERT